MCTHVFRGMPRFFYMVLSTNPQRLYTEIRGDCKICKIRIVIAFIAIFPLILNTCSPLVIHNLAKKRKNISTAVRACKQAFSGYIHRVTEVMHNTCVYFVDNFYLPMHTKKPYLCGDIHRKVRSLQLSLMSFSITLLRRGGSSRYARPEPAIYSPGPASAYPDCPSPPP